MIYLDNHATTRCDDRVVAEMLPWLTETYGNPSSTSHAFGRMAGEAVEQARTQVGCELGLAQGEVVFTSGATESNNLAIKGVCLHPRQKRRHVVTVTTEHPAVLDVIAEVERLGFRVTRVPVLRSGDSVGQVDLDALESAVDDDTALVSVMWANNEIGTINPMRIVADIAHSRGALLHCDATQGVGRLPVSIRDSGVDLLSASAHKFYGPKGAGVLVISQADRRVRLKPEIVGGGQQSNLRSGTMQPAGIIGFAAALRLAIEVMDDEQPRIKALRDAFAERLLSKIDGLQINGPSLRSDLRLDGNLNVQLANVEGETWMLEAPEVAFSSGSACSSVNPEPSHVLRQIGLSESAARRSVRFGLGRFTTREQLDEATEMLAKAHLKVAG